MEDLERLDHFVRHKIAALEADGTLQPGELRPEEVVDAVLVRASREPADRPAGRTIGGPLIGLAREQLGAAVARVKGWRDRTPLRTEQDVPETPPAEWVSSLGDERLDFYEPDEDLKVEDVVPDLDLPLPDEEAATKELRACVKAALAGMSAEWRELLLLRHVDGLAGADLARIAGKPEPEVIRMLDHARRDLRQRLVDAGCRFKAA